MKILFCMIFLHIIDDYYLQGVLAQMKQRSWWTKQDGYRDLYKHDYLCALMFHSFSWTFMIMLPIMIQKETASTFLIVFIVNMFIHGFIDDLKANKFKINLWTDQLIHLTQIVITWVICFV